MKKAPIILLGLLFLFATLIPACGEGDGSPSDGDVDGDSESPDGDQTADGDELLDGDTEIEVEEETAPFQPFDYCEPDTPPDAQCYAEKRDPQSANIKLAKAIADKQLALHPPETLKWDWGETVMLLGLVELYRVTGETKYRDYYKAWMDYHIQEGYLLGSSDTCAPAAVALALLKETGEDKYRGVMDAALNYLYNEALRTEEGGLNHLGIWDGLGITLWVDSLFMFGNVLTGWGEYADDLQALDEYTFQHEIFTRLLQEELGFYKHAYGYKGEQDDNVYWARGNSWVTVASFDHLRARQGRGEWNEGIAGIKAAVDWQVSAILDYQDEESGLFWTILNRPGESYLETSATALFALGMARGYRYDLADETVLPAIKAAMDGVRSKIITDDQDRPVITDISGPTGVGHFEMYATLDVYDDISYGIGAVLMALIETSGLLQEQ